MTNKKSKIGKSILFALIGLLFLLIPTLVSKYIMIIIGSMIIAYGIINMLTAINLGVNYKIKVSILICIFGVLFILLARFILSLIGIIFAIYCLISGFSNIGLGFKRKEMNLSYIFYFIKGFISLVASVLFFALPFSYIHIQIMVLGGYLIFSAINQIYKAFNGDDKDYDFVNFYFHKSNKEENIESNKNDDIIDVDASVKEEDK